MSKKDRLKKKAKLRKKLKKHTSVQLKKFRKYVTEHKLFRKAYLDDIDSIVVCKDGGYVRYDEDGGRVIYVIYNPNRNRKFTMDYQTYDYGDTDSIESRAKTITIERAEKLKRAFKKYVKYLNKKKKKK